MESCIGSTQKIGVRWHRLGSLGTIKKLWNEDLGRNEPMVTMQTADLLQIEQIALAKPRNWLKTEWKDDGQTVSPGNIRKWFTELRASFNRAKCVNPVVTDDARLLKSSPFDRYPKSAWCKPKAKPKRQYSYSQLLGLIDFARPFAALAYRCLFWSGVREMEIACLQWSEERIIDGEAHFRVTSLEEDGGKHGVLRWFRVPAAIYDELQQVRDPDNDFVFVNYCQDSMRSHMIKEFDPNRFAKWIYSELKRWSRAHSDGKDRVHMTRATAMQMVLRAKRAKTETAEAIRVNQQVAEDSYWDDDECDLRDASNAVFAAVAAVLPAGVATRMGY